MNTKIQKWINKVTPMRIINLGERGIWATDGCALFKTDAWNGLIADNAVLVRAFEQDDTWVLDSDKVADKVLSVFPAYIPPPFPFGEEYEKFAARFNREPVDFSGWRYDDSLLFVGATRQLWLAKTYVDMLPSSRDFYAPIDPKALAPVWIYTWQNGSLQGIAAICTMHAPKCGKAYWPKEEIVNSE